MVIGMVMMAVGWRYQFPAIWVSLQGCSQYGHNMALDQALRERVRGGKQDGSHILSVT